MICKAGNHEQIYSFGRIVMLAGRDGDPHGVESGVLWAGATLARCFPELFREGE